MFLDNDSGVTKKRALTEEQVLRYRKAYSEGTMSLGEITLVLSDVLKKSGVESMLRGKTYKDYQIFPTPVKETKITLNRLVRERKATKKIVHYVSDDLVCVTDIPYETPSPNSLRQIIIYHMHFVKKVPLVYVAEVFHYELDFTKEQYEAYQTEHYANDIRKVRVKYGRRKDVCERYKLL